MARRTLIGVCTCFALLLLAAGAGNAQTTSTTETKTKKKTSTVVKPAPAQCGGIERPEGPDGLPCPYSLANCHVADVAGRGVKVADTCPQHRARVCGCDGKTYATERDGEM